MSPTPHEILKITPEDFVGCKKLLILKNYLDCRIKTFRCIQINKKHKYIKQSLHFFPFGGQDILNV